MSRDRPRVDERAAAASRELRPRDGELRPLLVTETHCTSSSGHSHCMAELDVLHHLAGIGRGRGHQVVLVAEARRRAVVDNEAVLAQHQAVARPADGQRRERVGVEPVEQLRGVRALDVDLAQRRDIADADARCAPPAPRGCSFAASRSRPRAGTTARAARGRSRRRPRPAPRPSHARRAAGRAEMPCRGGGRRARRSPPACRAAGRSWCRPRRWLRPRSSAMMPTPLTSRSCPGRSPCRAWCSA